MQRKNEAKDEGLHMKQSQFITIEGTEGAGKSTALQYIKEYLQKANIEVVWTREPGGTALAEELRRLVLHPLTYEIVADETELLLMFAARAQHIKQVILPSLHEGKWVVSDRYIDASYAYQAGGRKMDATRIKWLEEWIVGSCYPNLTLLLDIAPQQGFERAEKRGTKKDRIEEEKIEFFIRVREAYLQRAQQDPDRIKVIDASVPLYAVQSQISEALNQFIQSTPHATKK